MNFLRNAGHVSSTSGHALGGLFAACYANYTMDGDEVVRIRSPLRAIWFEPLVSSQEIGQDPPNRTFVQGSNFEDLTDE